LPNDSSLEALLRFLRSKTQAKSHLNLSRRFCRKDLAEGVRSICKILGQIEIRAIEKIKRFGLASECKSFCEMEVAEQGQIE
jgi:hypothetical protein